MWAAQLPLVCWKRIKGEETSFRSIEFQSLATEITLPITTTLDRVLSSSMESGPPDTLSASAFIGATRRAQRNTPSPAVFHALKTPRQRRPMLILTLMDTP